MKAAFERWWLARHPRTATLKLTHHNVYILPTTTGWAYAATLVVLLLASVNYQLNLGHLLTFLLASTAVAALGATHAVLRGLELGLAQPVQGEAGKALNVELTLREMAPPAWWTPLGVGRHGISLQWRETGALPVFTDVSPGEPATVELSWTPPGRGLHTLPALTLSTRFPLGLFRAWAIWHPDALATVWPRPEDPPPPWPEAASAEAAQASTRTAAPEELEPEGVRPWRRGDRPRDVHWKLSARQMGADGPLMVRESRAPHTQGPLLLRWNDTPLMLPPERRLSRLCAWVWQAHHLRRPWKLELPGDPPATASHLMGDPAAPTLGADLGDSLKHDLHRLAACFHGVPL